MLSLVVAAFPTVFVIHVFGVFPCRRSRIVVFVAACAYGNILPVFPYIVQFFKFGIHLLHDGGVTTLVRVVLQCQPAVLLLQVRQTSYVLKISHGVSFYAPARRFIKYS